MKLESARKNANETTRTQPDASPLAACRIGDRPAALTRACEEIEVGDMHDLVQVAEAKDGSITYYPAGHSPAEGYHSCNRFTSEAFLRLTADPFAHTNLKDLVREISGVIIEAESRNVPSQFVGRMRQPEWYAGNFDPNIPLRITRVNVSSGAIGMLVRCAILTDSEIVLGDPEHGLVIKPAREGVSVRGGLSWSQERALATLPVEDPDSLSASIAAIFPDGYQLVLGHPGTDTSAAQQVLEQLSRKRGKYYIKACDSAGSKGLVLAEFGENHIEISIPNSQLAEAAGLKRFIGFESRPVSLAVLQKACRYLGAAIIERAIETPGIPVTHIRDEIIAQPEVRMFMQREDQNSSFSCTGAYSHLMHRALSVGQEPLEDHIAAMFDEAGAPAVGEHEKQEAVKVVGGELERRLEQYCDEFSKLYAERYPESQPLLEIDVDYFLVWKDAKLDILVLETHPVYSGYRGLASVDPDRARAVHESRVRAAKGDAALLRDLEAERRKAFGETSSPAWIGDEP